MDAIPIQANPLQLPTLSASNPLFDFDPALLPLLPDLPPHDATPLELDDLMVANAWNAWASGIVKDEYEEADMFSFLADETVAA